MTELTQEHLQQLEEAIKKDPRFVSSGAKKYFKKVWLGYALLAVATVVGIWAFTTRSDKNLRHEINSLGKNSCLSSRVTVGKYNDLIDSIIITRQQGIQLAKSQHDKKTIKIDKYAIKRYRTDKLASPTEAQCDLPIIKP